ncbi:hypothetical protein CesoFtcFv8_015297 [Champsocephalus esox]|uniref:Uncharacterized protein n=1 Tax=Champsocephalus esox TaxID=159716 RepID=A0AAN8GRX7_9TELE|nr:hypothetical protein CesoFtcFv8_015297 [Champsocephalus esox]
MSLILTSLVATPAFVHGHVKVGNKSDDSAVVYPTFASFSLPKNSRTAGELLQLQTHSRAAADRTICQTIPGGTGASKYSSLLQMQEFN